MVLFDLGCVRMRLGLVDSFRLLACVCVLRVCVAELLYLCCVLVSCLVVVLHLVFY